MTNPPRSRGTMEFTLLRMNHTLTLNIVHIFIRNILMQLLQILEIIFVQCRASSCKFVLKMASKHTHYTGSW